MNYAALLITYFVTVVAGSVIDLEAGSSPEIDVSSSSNIDSRGERQLERIFGFGQSNNAVLATLHYARATVVIYNTMTTTAWKSCYTGIKTVTCSKRKREAAPEVALELGNGLRGARGNGIYTVGPAEYYEQLDAEMEKAMEEASEREAREARLLDAEIVAAADDDAAVVVELESSGGFVDAEGPAAGDRAGRSVDLDGSPGLELGADVEAGGADDRHRMRLGLWGLGGSNSNEPIHLAKTSTTTVVSTVFQTMFGTQIITISYQRCVAPGSPVNPAC